MKKVHLLASIREQKQIKKSLFSMKKPEENCRKTLALTFFVATRKVFSDEFLGEGHDHDMQNLLISRAWGSADAKLERKWASKG